MNRHWLPHFLISIIFALLKRNVTFRFRRMMILNPWDLKPTSLTIRIRTIPFPHYSPWPNPHHESFGKPPIVKYLSTPLANTKFNESRSRLLQMLPHFPHNFSPPSSSFIALLIAQYFVLSITFTRIVQRISHVVIQCTPSSNLILSSRSSVGLTFLQ